MPLFTIHWWLYSTRWEHGHDSSQRFFVSTSSQSFVLLAPSSVSSDSFRLLLVLFFPSGGSSVHLTVNSSVLAKKNHSSRTSSYALLIKVVFRWRKEGRVDAIKKVFLKWNVASLHHAWNFLFPILSNRMYPLYFFLHLLRTFCYPVTFLTFIRFNFNLF